MGHARALSCAIARHRRAVRAIGELHAQGGVDPNSAPNPYREDAGWAKLRPGANGARRSASTSIATARASGCSTAAAPPKYCEGSSLAPIQKFDASGKLVTSFGAGLFKYPHGVPVDRDDNDLGSTDGQGNGKGHTVMKFSPDGQLLMTLGKPGVAGNGPDHVQRPVRCSCRARMATSSSPTATAAKTNARVVKLLEGRQVHQGVGPAKGRAPGEFDVPHGLAIDSAGPPVRRRSRQQPHPDLRPGWTSSSPSGGSSAGRAASSSTRTTSSTSPTRSRTDEWPTRGSRRASASAASRTARSPPSFRGGRDQHARRGRGR